MPARLRALGLVAVALAAAVAVGWLGLQWNESRIPGTYSVMDHGQVDYGGGAVPPTSVAHGERGHDHAGPHPVPVSALRGPRDGKPDARFTLTARTADVRLASGRVIEALTFNGRVPGPELRVRQGDLVEVELRNADVDDGVSVHWHGVDVPNGEDGVAGVTQDAVQPGGRHVYRFRAEQLGTFWYHTHQSSAEDVRRGLFGAFVIAPREPFPGRDLTLVAHRTGGQPALNAVDGVRRMAVAPGTPVRLRLVNAAGTPERFALSGTPFRVVAIDGTDLNEPGLLTGTELELAGGGRYDVAFTMPARPVGVSLSETEAGLALSADGAAGLPPTPSAGVTFDPAAYGRPTGTPFDARSGFDRRFRFDIGRKPGFLDGRPGFHWTVNGGIFPDVPMFVVEPGDLVHVTIENDTKAVHPMHLHGHHMLVLSRDGRTVSGSPWWSDTLNVQPGETYEVGFRASNPGLWMDHCHNLQHAAEGLTMHVAYAGVTTPFLTGGPAHNAPE